MARQNEPPANDNEDPDESWKRADLILQAYSGADLSNPEAQKTAISQLVTDLMHYCDVMSTTAKAAPSTLISKTHSIRRFEHFSVQKETMDGAMEIGPRKLAAIGQHFRELREGEARHPEQSGAARRAATIAKSSGACGHEESHRLGLLFFGAHRGEKLRAPRRPNRHTNSSTPIHLSTTLIRQRVGSRSTSSGLNGLNSTITGDSGLRSYRPSPRNPATQPISPPSRPPETFSPRAA